MSGRIVVIKMAESSSARSDSDLIKGDIISIESRSKSKKSLKGIVAYVGTVSFAEGTWIGVRLIGDSIGEGRTNGSVQGKQYFDDCGHKGGIFIRISSASQKKLEKPKKTRKKSFSNIMDDNSWIPDSPDENELSPGKIDPLFVDSSSKEESKREFVLVNKERSFVSIMTDPSAILSHTEQKIENLRKEKETLSRQNQKLLGRQKSMEPELDRLRAQADSLQTDLRRKSMIAIGRKPLPSKIPEKLQLDEEKSPERSPVKEVQKNLGHERSTSIKKPKDSEKRRGLRREIKNLKYQLEQKQLLLDQTSFARSDLQLLHQQLEAQLFQLQSSNNKLKLKGTSGELQRFPVESKDATSEIMRLREENYHLLIDVKGMVDANNEEQKEGIDKPIM